MPPALCFDQSTPDNVRIKTPKKKVRKKKGSQFYTKRKDSGARNTQGHPQFTYLAGNGMLTLSIINAPKTHVLSVRMHDTLFLTSVISTPEK